MLHSLAQPLAYLGAVLGVGMVVPQLIRTIRHPRLTGVSALSWGLMALGCAMWLDYGLRTSSIVQLPGNTVLVAGAVAVVLLVPSRWSRTGRAAVLATVLSTLVLASLVLPPATVGYVAFSLSLVSAWPQLIESYGNSRAGIVSGLSLPTYFVRIASISCWLSYALISTDVPVAVSATFGLTATTAIIVMEGTARQRAAFGASDLDLELEGMKA